VATILLTGGAGDLGTVLTPLLQARGHRALRLDIRKPADHHGEFVQGSILNREKLPGWLQGVDVVVHIAAWHGIHEARGLKDAFDFWDLNVTGAFNLFEACARAGIDKVVNISSTSVEDREGIYGFTKLLGEQIAGEYVARRNMNVVTLRPRAFIPHWNRDVYRDFVEWARWFWPGAVHIGDVAAAVLAAIDLLLKTRLDEHLILTLDSAHEYTDGDLEDWDAGGPGSAFRKYYAGYEALALQHGLDPALKPTKKDISAAQKWLGYQPAYSLRSLLEELKAHGASGPPQNPSPNPP
jgi:nucleoside-diphosphate-sugar epimerase